MPKKTNKKMRKPVKNKIKIAPDSKITRGSFFVFSFTF